MAKKYRPEKFIKDVIIAGDDGKLYFLTESEWKKRAVPLSKVSPEIKNALQNGVALAAIPEHQSAPTSHRLDKDGKPVHTLGFCYLVSFASLRTHTTFEK